MVPLTCSQQVMVMVNLRTPEWGRKCENIMELRGDLLMRCQEGGILVKKMYLSFDPLVMCQVGRYGILYEYQEIT